MTTRLDAPEGQPKETALPSFDFGFDTEAFSDRILRLQYEDVDENAPEGSTDQVDETPRTRRRLDCGRDDRDAVLAGGPAESAAAPGRDLRVNSLVLAARSDFFRTMLQSGMLEAGRDKPAIVLRIAKDDEAAIVTMIRFIYSGALAPDPVSDTDALLKQLLIGDKYQCSSFVTAVAAKLASLNDLTIPFCDRALNFLEGHPFPRSHTAVDQFSSRVKGILLANFKDVAAKWNGDEFLALSQATVAFLLQSEDLEAQKEADVLDGLLRWVNSMSTGMERRARVMADLSKHIRYRMIGGEKLRVIKELDVMRSSAEKVMEAVWFRSLTDEVKEQEASGSGGKADYRDRMGVSSFNYFLEFSFPAFRLEAEAEVFSDIAVEVDGTYWQLRLVVRDDETGESLVGVFLVPTETSDGDQLDWVSRDVHFDLGVKVWPSGRRKVVDRMRRQRFSMIGEGWGMDEAFDGLSVEELRKSKWVSKEGFITVNTYFRPV